MSTPETQPNKKKSAREGANADPRFKQLNQQVSELNATIGKRNKQVGDLQRQVAELGAQIIQLKEQAVRDAENKEREIKSITQKMKEVEAKSAEKLQEAKSIENEIKKLQRRLAEKQAEVDLANKLWHEANGLKDEAQKFAAENETKIMKADQWRREGMRLHEQLKVLSHNYRVLVANKRNGAINHAAEQLAPTIMQIDAEFSGKVMDRDTLLEIARRLSTAYYGAEVRFAAEEMKPFDENNVPEVELDENGKLPEIEDPTKQPESGGQ